MRFLIPLLLIALVSGCVTKPERLPPEIVHDFCEKDRVLWFDHDATIDYLRTNEPQFLRDYTEHNTLYEKACPQ